MFGHARLRRLANSRRPLSVPRRASRWERANAAVTAGADPVWTLITWLRQKSVADSSAQARLGSDAPSRALARRYIRGRTDSVLETPFTYLPMFPFANGFASRHRMKSQK